MKPLDSKSLILNVLDLYSTTEDKLDILTSLSVQDANDEILKVCEEIRSELVDGEASKEKREVAVPTYPQRVRDNYGDAKRDAAIYGTGYYQTYIDDDYDRKDLFT